MTDTREHVREALAKQMYADKKLAYGVVTGAITWPPENGESMGELATMAADKAFDLEQAEKLGSTVSHFEVDQLYAAEQCFVWLEHDAEDDLREAEDAYERWQEGYGHRLIGVM